MSYWVKLLPPTHREDIQTLHVPVYKLRAASVSHAHKMSDTRRAHSTVV